MSRVALIHGYAIGLTSPGIRRGFGATAGFRAFAADITAGEAAVFRWGLERAAPWHALLDPVAQYRFYLAEQADAVSVATQERLRVFLERERPSVVVAHSMGTALLLAYARAHGLPPCVRHVVMAQSDLIADADLSAFPRVHNLYCPWDPTLLASAVMSRRRRAGLGPVRGAHVTNLLLPAWRLPNLHTSAPRDPQMRDYARRLADEVAA
jgi:alpha-beta hydrolase superfamily lysophospholipase